jgi:hypothetical protein
VSTPLGGLTSVVTCKSRCQDQSSFMPIMFNPDQEDSKHTQHAKGSEHRGKARQAECILFKQGMKSTSLLTCRCPFCDIPLTHIIYRINAVRESQIAMMVRRLMTVRIR